MRLGGRAYGGSVAPQERIDANLERQRRGQGGRTGGAGALHGVPIVLCGAVAGIHRQGESQVGGGVFVPAKHAGFRRQIAQAIERSIHLYWRTLEHSATTGAEQRVAAEQRTMPPKRNVT